MHPIHKKSQNDCRRHRLQQPPLHSQTAKAKPAVQICHAVHPCNSTKVQPCTAFEGQTLKDIGVVCSKDTANCRVLVLHGHGQSLSTQNP
eukprot:2022346-Amphidinium_carterae.1